MVSSTFLAQLGRLDRALYLKLDRVRQRYVVYRRDRSNVPREILTLEDNSGDFSYPNAEHIAKLYQMDMLNNKDLIRNIDEHNKNLDRERDAQLHRVVRETVNRMTRSQYY